MLSTYIILVCRMFVHHHPSIYSICIWRQSPSSDILKWFRCVILSRIARPDDSHLLECIYQPQWQKTITTPVATIWKTSKGVECARRRLPFTAVCARFSVYRCCCCCSVIHLQHYICVYTVCDCWKTLHAVIHFARFWLPMLLRYNVRSHTLKQAMADSCARKSYTSIRNFTAQIYTYELVSSACTYI